MKDNLSIGFIFSLNLLGGNFALHLFEHNELLTFIARILSFITFGVFIFINWNRIKERIKEIKNKK